MLDRRGPRYRLITLAQLCWAFLLPSIGAGVKEQRLSPPGVKRDSLASVTRKENDDMEEQEQPKVTEPQNNQQDQGTEKPEKTFTREQIGGIVD